MGAKYSSRSAEQNLAAVLCTAMALCINGGVGLDILLDLFIVLVVYAPVRKCKLFALSDVLGRPEGKERLQNICFVDIDRSEPAIGITAMVLESKFSNKRADIGDSVPGSE
jgi:hypothetical protein